jgi:hypothetical protein
MTQQYNPTELFAFKIEVLVFLRKKRYSLLIGKILTPSSIPPTRCQMTLLVGLPESSGGRVSFPQPTPLSPWLSTPTHHPRDEQNGLLVAAVLRLKSHPINMINQSIDQHENHIRRRNFYKQKLWKLLQKNHSSQSGISMGHGLHCIHLTLSCLAPVTSGIKKGRHLMRFTCRGNMHLKLLLKLALPTSQGFVVPTLTYTAYGVLFSRNRHQEADSVTIRRQTLLKYGTVT